MEDEASEMAYFTTHYSKHRYIEYQVGNLNVILSVPHGGRLRPAHIPPRDAGYCDPSTGKPRYDHDSDEKDFEKYGVRYKKDTNTIDLAVFIANAVRKLTGKRPHVIICHMHRSKLDMNCDKDKATFAVKTAEEAWTAYHKFIEDAKQSFKGAAGLFLDIHGQAHMENWVELGYTLDKNQLNSNSYEAADTSIRFLANRMKESVPVSELIYGLDSFGGILLDEGYKVVPSPTYPGPGSGNYYTGGYNTQTHGSKAGGIIDGIQIESPRSLREKAMIPEYSQAVARTIVKFLQLYYNKAPREDLPKTPESPQTPELPQIKSSPKIKHVPKTVGSSKTPELPKD